MLGYRVDFEQDDNDMVLITCPALPEVTSFGTRDGDDRFLAARGAVGEALAARMAAGAVIPDGDADPAPSDTHRVVYLEPLVAMKVELFRAMRVAAVSRAELQRRLGWHREQVDRLLRLGHRSRVDQLDEAFHALGLRLDVRAVSQAA